MKHSQVLQLINKKNKRGASKTFIKETPIKFYCIGL
jgi:hypothetical protein